VVVGEGRTKGGLCCGRVLQKGTGKRGVHGEGVGRSGGESRRGLGRSSCGCRIRQRQPEEGLSEDVLQNTELRRMCLRALVDGGRGP